MLAFASLAVSVPRHPRTSKWEGGVNRREQVIMFTHIIMCTVHGSALAVLSSSQEDRQNLSIRIDSSEHYPYIWCMHEVLNVEKKGCEESQHFYACCFHCRSKMSAWSP